MQKCFKFQSKKKDTRATSVYFLFMSIHVILVPFFVNFEVVYVTIGNPAFCFALFLTGIHFRGKLQHVGHVGK